MVMKFVKKLSILQNTSEITHQRKKKQNDKMAWNYVFSIDLKKKKKEMDNVPAKEMLE